MSCNRSNMPINIIETNNKCDMTCNFKYSYGNSDLSVTNNGTYLTFSYDGTTNVLYNGNTYTVQDIRIYKPSINSYYGSKVDAEMMIHHVSVSGGNLLVCIPILSSANASSSITMFNKIIPFVPSTRGETRTININNYTLNNFIPKSGFYSYNGNLPYEPCNGNYNIILFDSKQGIHMSPTDLSTIGSLIKATTQTIKKHDTTALYFNNKGTIENTLTGEDEIYIDCQPVDELEDGVEVTSTSLDGNGTSRQTATKTPEYTKNMKYVEIIGGIAGGLLLFHFLTQAAIKVYAKVSSS